MSELGEQEEVKQEKVTSVKKEHSYTYWVDKEKQNNASVPKKEPKQIDPSQIQQNQQKHVSSWNQSGTWEEKKIDVSQLKDLLENSLKEKPLAGIDKRIEFYNVSKVEGEVTIVVVRGKKKPGYHLKINIDYRGINEYQGAEGVFKYTSFSDDGDRDYEVENSGEVHADICSTLASKSQDIVEERLLEVLQQVHE